MGSNRGIHRLTALAVSRLKTPGMYADGGGLYLQVRGPTSRSWIFRYRFSGRERELGLGSFLTVSLAEARERAATARKQKSDGIDPLETKLEVKAARQAVERKAKVPTFDQAVLSYIRSQMSGWKNAKHQQQWSNTLSSYASPYFGSWDVSDVDVAVVVRALQPIWATKSETASRVRGRIESVLDWATVMGFRSGDNPARWKGNLDKILPARARLTKVKHHAALPYADMPLFMESLETRSEVAARALLFTILTAARTSEVLGMRWSELDLELNVWTVPSDRMKADREHRVPFSEGARSLIARMAPGGGEGLVFPGPKEARPLSINAMSAVLKRMGRNDITVHGFRSSFRDWAAEQTTTPNEVVEAALAHTIQNKVEAAYRRGDLLEKRRALMVAWSDYVLAER